MFWCEVKSIQYWQGDGYLVSDYWWGTFHGFHSLGFTGDAVCSHFWWRQFFSSHACCGHRVMFYSYEKLNDGCLLLLIFSFWLAFSLQIYIFFFIITIHGFQCNFFPWMKHFFYFSCNSAENLHFFSLQSNRRYEYFFLFIFALIIHQIICMFICHGLQDTSKILRCFAWVDVHIVLAH